MNLELYERVYSGLHDYIADHSKIHATVLKKPKGDTFPRIIFTEISNVGMSINDPHSLVGFEADIYADNVVEDGVMIDSMDVARYLQGLVAEYFEKMRFKRIMCKPAPRYDDTKYRIVMRYTGTASDTRGHFF